ncbi:conjugal transfer protein TraV [Rickettsia endosymbiont of Orchestes rusci]|uniref:conjugal transfer protein TraV n=1 Tax=Rickettsia endosymbiont of Orchestes rusci TaxID=3066250 RepID=UPI00313AC73A
MNNKIINLLLLLMLSFSVANCKLMPYRNDFDCPLPQGLKCKSLYEVNKMADFDMFNPNNNNDKPNFKSRCFARCSGRYNNDIRN